MLEEILNQTNIYYLVKDFKYLMNLNYKEELAGRVGTELFKILNECKP